VPANDGDNQAKASTMTDSKSGARLGSYLQAFFATLLCFSLIVVLEVHLAQRGVSFISSLLILSILISPLFIIWLYAMYRALVPVTEGMPLRGFKQWALIYPFIAGYGLSWVFLALFFDTYVPFLSREDREIFLPILAMSTITIILSVTRLRYPLARFLNKVFGTEAIANA
jgi:hypothetical protein